MSYTPKSKYQILKSSGNQYEDPRTGKPYVGPYILTSEGAFIGNSVYKPGPKLKEYKAAVEGIDLTNFAPPLQKTYDNESVHF